MRARRAAPVLAVALAALGLVSGCVSSRGLPKNGEGADVGQWQSAPASGPESGPESGAASGAESGAAQTAQADALNALPAALRSRVPRFPRHRHCPTRWRATSSRSSQHRGAEGDSG